MSNWFEVTNNKQDIIKTNYFESTHAKKGFFFCTLNAGCIRLLIPEPMETEISEMKTGKIIIITKGFWEEKSKDGVEIMFEDNSDSPFVLHLVTDQFDMLPENGKKWKFAGWTSKEKVFTRKCYVRTKAIIPFLDKW